MASGAATAPGAMLTDWGFLGLFIALSSKDLLTCNHSTGLMRIQNYRDTTYAFELCLCLSTYLTAVYGVAATADQVSLYRLKDIHMIRKTQTAKFRATTKKQTDTTATQDYDRTRASL